MAISPPGDLVLDVVNAAGPGDVEAAREKLRAKAADAAAVRLASAGEGFAAGMTDLGGAASKAGLGNVRHEAVKGAAPEAYRKFEAAILSNFIQNMLPSESEEVYGKGSAGEFWKSMMAEQMANAVSERGGIGIADQLYAKSLTRQGRPNAVTDENDRSMVTSSIMDFQRRVLGVNGTEDKDKAAAKVV